MSNVLILLDESGDLGWELDKPYRDGGSSRFFTIGATVGINNGHRHASSVVKAMGREFQWSTEREKKWTGLGTSVKRAFARRAADMIRRHPDIHLMVAVIDKRRVPRQVRGHFHLFYSWITSSLIGPEIRRHRQASLCPDELNAGVGNAMLLENLLRRDLWFSLRSATEIRRVARHSALEDGLTFCDFLAGSFQSHFEDGQSEAFSILKDHVYLHQPWT